MYLCNLCMYCCSRAWRPRTGAGGSVNAEMFSSTTYIFHSFSLVIACFERYLAGLCEGEG
jgi:hypothetical protein